MDGEKRMEVSEELAANWPRLNTFRDRQAVFAWHRPAQRSRRVGGAGAVSAWRYVSMVRARLHVMARVAFLPVGCGVDDGPPLVSDTSSSTLEHPLEGQEIYQLGPERTSALRVVFSTDLGFTRFVIPAGEALHFTDMTRGPGKPTVHVDKSYNALIGARPDRKM